VFRHAPSGPVGPGAGHVASITCARYCYTPILVWAVTIEQHVKHTSKTARVTANDVSVLSLRGSSVRIGKIQRRFAWALRNDDTHKSRSVNNLMRGHVVQGCLVSASPLGHLRREWQDQHSDDQGGRIVIQRYLALSCDPFVWRRRRRSQLLLLWLLLCAVHRTVSRHHTTRSANASANIMRYGDNDNPELRYLGVPSRKWFWLHRQQRALSLSQIAFGCQAAAAKAQAASTFALLVRCHVSHAADVRCKEHDVRCGPTSRSLPHRRVPLPWPNEHQGS